jgi:hypothetical protein
LDYDNLEITPEGWKWVFFAITGDDGSTTNAWLLRPIEWLQKNGVDEIDKTMWINLPGIEINGLAKVVGFIQNEVDTRIKKEINSRQESYIYRPIIGWFQRNSPEIWEYSFSNGDSIQATPNHPFYSDDKKAFVPIGQFSLYEKLKAENEKDVFLNSKTRLPIENPVVYNLEVWKDHNFLVGKGHILVHNDCFKTFRDYLASKGFGSMQQCSPKTTFGAKAIPCENCIYGAIQLADDRIVPIDKLAFPRFENFTLKSGNSSPASYEIDMKGNYSSDINLAYAQFQNSDLYSELIGLGYGIEDFGTRIAITPPPGGGDIISYTWHHHQDIKHMMLVETSVHEAVHHTGGRALASTFRDDLGFFDLITKPEF